MFVIATLSLFAKFFTELRSAVIYIHDVSLFSKKSSSPNKLFFARVDQLTMKDEPSLRESRKFRHANLKIHRFRKKDPSAQALHMKG